MIERLRQLVNPMLTFLGAYTCYHNTRYTSRFIQSFAPLLLLVLSSLQVRYFLLLEGRRLCLIASSKLLSRFVNSSEHCTCLVRLYVFLFRLYVLV